MSDPDGNLLEALLSLPHQWPTRPSTAGVCPAQATPLLEAMSWIVAAGSLAAPPLPALAGIRWPRALHRLKIVGAGAHAEIARQSGFTNKAVELPDLLARDCLAGLADFRLPLSSDQARAIAFGMAEAFRRMLFGSPERAREAVQRNVLAFYYDGPTFERFNLTWAEPTDNGGALSPFILVSPGVLAIAHKRAVARVLYTADNLPVSDGQRTAFVPLPTAEDREAFSVFGLLTRDHMHRDDAKQRVRNAAMLFSVGGGLDVLAGLGWEHGIGPGSEPELSLQLAEAAEPGAPPLPDSVRLHLLSEPWRLAGVNPEGLKLYIDALALRGFETEEEEYRQRETLLLEELPRTPAPSPAAGKTQRKRAAS